MGMSPEAKRRCRDLVEDRQAEDRVPGVAAGIVRGGEAVWSLGLGMADPDRPDEPPVTDTQFRIASITKTFTAALVMQLRDAGRLDLNDPLERHVPATSHGELTVGRLLAHRSGLQREPTGEVWKRTELPAGVKLLEGFEQAEVVLPPGGRWHYSNLAYGLLGEVVERLTGQPWAEAVSQRLLAPLAMERTGVEAVPPAACGLFVDPYADRVRVESDARRRRLDAVGGLWSTVEDLCRWAAFLAAPDPQVLNPSTVAEMCEPRVVTDVDTWTRSWGLGIELERRGGRVLAGHSGAVPGYRSGLLVSRTTGVGAVVLTNTSAGTDPLLLAGDLVEAVLEIDPPRRVPWRPGPPVPRELEGVLGAWWSEGEEVVLRYVGGRLEARAAALPAKLPLAVFAAEGPDRLRTVSGRELGEQLRIVRDDDGQPVRLYWATYPLTRRPEPFSDDWGTR